MSKDKVSIIIPVYNAEQTIEKCIKSIKKQTYSNVEIVCVDDGSSDSSKKLIEKMQSKDDRIVHISQKNSGAYMARKAGVLKSTGDYIMFVDADDELINRNAIINLLGYFDEYSDIQIVQFGYRLHKTRILTKDVSSDSVVKISFEELKKKYYPDLVGWVPKATVVTTSWGKLFKSNILKETIKGTETRLKLCEDKLLILKILFSGLFDNLLIVPGVYYKYNKYLGNSSNFDYTVFYDYGNDLKSYQNYLCDNFLPSKAKYNCNMETVYYFKSIIAELIIKKQQREDVLAIIAECDEYEFVKNAKKYFCSLDDKRLLYKELEFLCSEYTPMEYYDYVNNHLPKESLKRAIINKCTIVIRKIGL